MNNTPRPGYDIPLGDLIDFHCHILPGVDDGAKNINVSWEMVDLSARQGIQALCFTPHFYADRDDPAKFFARRDKAFIDLKRSVPTVYPVMTCGAEIHYFEGIASMDTIMRMRISGTDLLLIEMPFQKWTERCVSDIIEINSRKGIQVFLAHIERYECLFGRRIYRLKREHTVRYQVNCRTLVRTNMGFLKKWQLRRWFKKELIDYVASDMHDLKARRNRMGASARALEKICSQAYIARLMGIQVPLG